MVGLHRVLAENVLHGYDVLDTAVHLTGVHAVLCAPQSHIHQDVRLFNLPLGGEEMRLGSIEFLFCRHMADLAATCSVPTSARRRRLHRRARFNPPLPSPTLISV